MPLNNILTFKSFITVKKVTKCIVKMKQTSKNVKGVKDIQ